MLVIIILFLFCSISITASDFFCPNLATLAAYLGLSETTAGVTLLAFGNGSPDVFSTFVSVRQGTFGLAVGELIGAASFITSIVVGSIAIIKPFHVPKAAFLRDVTFFTLAVLLLMRVLSDGHLTLRESSSMILLYVLYVAVVVAGSWWARRRRRRAAYADLGWKAALDDDAGSTHSADVEFPGPSESLTLTPSGTYPRRVSLSRAPPDDLLTEEREADTQRATWSLLGAVEFRDAVNALKREGTPASSHLGSRPASPVADHDEHHGNHGHQGHHHGHHHHGSGSPFGVRRNGSLRRSTRSRSSSVVAGWIARSRHQSHTDLTTDALHPQSQSPFASPTLETVPDSPAMFDTPPVPPTQPEHPALDNEVDPLDTEVLEHPLASLAPRLSALRHDDDEPLSPAESHGVPRITIVDPHGSRASPPLMLRRTDTQVSIADRVNHTFHRAVHTLFPSLQGFTNKSIVGMVLAVLSTPALLILTLTLPVVDDGRAGDEGEIALPGEEDEELGLNGNANGLTEEPEPRDRLVAGDLSDDMHNLVEGGVYRRQHMPDSSAIVRSGVSCAASEDGEDEEECVLEFSPILASLQCFFGPVVCAWLLFRECHQSCSVLTNTEDEDHVFWILLVASLAGAGAGAVVYSLAEDGTAHPWRLVRCCAGFVCSMVWIASIADEVVAVLQTFGEISGLSDAIIGLTSKLMNILM